MIERSCDRQRPCRHGSFRAPPRARADPRRQPTPTSCCSASPTGRSPMSAAYRSRAVGRPRQRRDAPLGARAAHAAVRRPPAADVHPAARRRAARRSVGRGHRRERRGARRRHLARRDARAPAVSLARQRSRHLSRRRSDRIQLPRHAATRGRLAARGCGSPARGTRSADARTIENGFELTGPIQRGDWETVERHLDAIRACLPRARTALPGARRRDGGGRMKVCRTIAEVRLALEPLPRWHGRARSDDGSAACGALSLLARRAPSARPS